MLNTHIPLKPLIAQQRVVIASSNAGKVRDFASLLAPLGWSTLGLHEVDAHLPIEAQGPQATLAGNATLKAETVATHLNDPTLWVLADDSGLFVDALHGAPGVDTAHYGGYPKLLEAMRDIPNTARQAEFRCVLALARPGMPTLLAQGTDTGCIAPSAQGDHGFGYDPVFIPTGFSQTFAELKARGALPFSHRGRAVSALIEALATP